MNKLINELQRLYFLRDPRCPGQAADDDCLAGETATALNMIGADGKVRAMVMSFDRASDWDQVAHVYQAVQSELNLPAPAVSVSGGKAYGLWFSLADAVPVAEAQAFLEALQLTYLADLPAIHLDLRPQAATPVVELPPALQAGTAKWSAFIDPTLGSMFVDEPWLDMSPNMDKQADILASLDSIKADDFQQALLALRISAAANADPAPQAASPQARPASSEAHGDPQSFLLAVMNDPLQKTRLRIAAAKALMPYFHPKIGGQQNVPVSVRSPAQ